jgi:flagellar M-ring protein FliF
MAEMHPQSVISRIFGGQLQGQQLIALMIAAATIVALVAGGWMWSRTPDYRVLYSNLTDRDGGAVIAALQQMNVPYRFAEGGAAILVPAERVHEMRLRLAGQGLPRGGSVGFELMENQKLVTSQFLEQVNYQRALEGELARTIQSVAAVQSARVHLALSRPSVFVREQQKPSASVMLNLYPGRSLDAAQVSAIVHVVSNSVPELSAKNVTVVDQNGTLLSQPADGSQPLGLDANQLKYVRELEQSYARRIEAILTPIVGPTNVRAQVAAEVDFSHIERAEEIYTPNQNAIRSQQISESSSAAAQAAGGVPGAASNQPAAEGAKPPPPGAAPANVRKDSTTNFELDRTIRHVRQPVGTIRKLSVAVVVNHRRELDAAGQATMKPLPEAEMTQIQDLVREAMGYNKERGDSLNVANTPFAGAETEPVPEIAWWKQPATIALAKEIAKHALIVLLGLYLLFGVLRPLIRNLSKPRPEVLPPLANDDGGPPRGGPPALGYEQNLQLARQLARDDPKVVASVVKNWVAGNER